MKCQFSVLLASTLCLAGVSASAQTPPAVNQADAVKRQQELEQQLLQATKPGTVEMDAPELFQGELKDVGPQSILKMTKARTRFEAVVDSQFLYTSNQNLTEDATGTTLFVNTLQLAYAPDAFRTARGPVLPRVGFRHQWFNYGLGDRPASKGDVDFDLQTVFADTRWAFSQDWVAEAGLEWSRLLNHTPSYTSYRQFYSEWLPRVGLTRQVSFSETRSLTLGWQLNYHLSDSPDAALSVPPAPRSTNDRMDNSFLVAYTHLLNPRLTLQPYYRLMLTRFGGQSGRFDYLHSVGLSAYIALHEKVSLRTFMSYEVRDSDTPAVADYTRFDLGMGLNLNVRF